MFEDGEQVIHKERSFFGVLQVIDGKEFEPRRLFNGSTMHGAQFQNPEVRRAPTSYFGVATGIGISLQAKQPHVPRRVGVVGLGIGTLASYGKPGDYFRFYEIDPAVIRLATDPAYFSFLEDSEAELEIVTGDARLALTSERAQGTVQDFDLLVIDAFSSDAIPVHLLTREAFEIYLNALAEDGMLALHVSNKHFDLISVAARAGLSVGLESVYIHNRIVPRRFTRPSRWVFLSRDPKQLQGLEASVERRRRSLGLNSKAITVEYFDTAALETGPLWTDDYSDLFGALIVLSD
jgi:spermidine synthase